MTDMIKHVLTVTSLNKATSKREKVGDVDIYVPTLASLGVAVDQTIDGDKKPIVDDDNMPVYADDKHNFVQGAIFAAVKSIARNRLQAGTVDLKDNASIPTDWEALTAEVVRVGGGAGLVIYQEVKALFSAHIASLGKSKQAYDIITGLFNNKKQLMLSDEASKSKILAYVAEFADTLTAEQAAKFERTLTNIADICESETVNSEDW